MFTVLTVYAKLFSRITESSLMEESIPVRYTFVMLLAIADPTGLVVGTDVALSRRLNMPLNQFIESITVLGAPDPDSNSKEMEGRRVVPSDGERGYQIVNFVKYKLLKDESERREYMKEYMRKYRNPDSVNTRKLPLVSPSASASTYASVPFGESENLLPVNLPSHFPKTEAEAKAHAEFVGATPEFAVHTWNKAMSRNGRDAKGQPIASFRHYLAAELVYAKEREQSEAKANGKPTSVFNLREIIKVKEERAVNIRARFCSETASGHSWSDPAQQKEYVKLRKEIKDMKLKLESLA